MTIPEILKELEPYTGRFPMKAMKAAIEQREALTPELLRVLEAVAEAPEQYARREGYMLHVFALYLLAQFRERRAYPFVAKMFRAPGEISFDLVGDTVTETLNRIFASVYDGDSVPLQTLVESEEANEYVRDAALDAFVVLAHTGQIARDDVAAYFASLFHGKLNRSYSHVWDRLVVAVADLPAPELLDDVRQAYAEGLVDSFFARFEQIESGTVRRRKKEGIITDAIAELEWWTCFHTPQKSSPPAAAVAPQVPAESVQHKKPWRNAPCPCGSGLKYKKCCGAAKK